MIVEELSAILANYELLEYNLHTVEGCDGAVVVLMLHRSHNHNVTPFSQRDPRWAGDSLGFSTSTLGGYGCAVTSIAMLASVAYPGMTPAIANVALRNENAFSGGDLIWERVSTAFDRLEFLGRYDWDKRMTAEQVSFVKRMIREHGPQVLEVDFKARTAAQEQHFVLAIAVDGDDLRIIDPWDGVEKSLLLAYGDSDNDGVPDFDLARAIWGLRAYEVK